MKYKLENKKNVKALFIGGIATLAITLQMGTININSQEDTRSVYNEYSYEYINALNNMDYSDFDENFIDIYKNGIYNIEGINYDIDEVYVVSTEDGSNHLIKAGENDTDILTKEKFSGKKTKIMCLKNSSIFYSLYNDGVIIDKNIFIDNIVMKKYVDNWDGKKQDNIPQLRADKKANENMNGKKL